MFDYLLRDMTRPDGGLYAAEDADSLDPASGEKKEGWFYVWSQSEIEELLGEGGGACCCCGGDGGGDCCCGCGPPHQWPLAAQPVLRASMPTACVL